MEKEEININTEEGNMMLASSKEEIKQIVSKMKNNKSPGNDKVTAKLFEYGKQKL